MILTGEQKEILREGILGAYPYPDELIILLSDTMDVKFNEIARGENYKTQVFNLIETFEADGRLEKFIRAIVYSKPYSSYLEEVRLKFSEIIDFSKTLKIWEENRYELVKKLLDILKKRLNDSLFFVNYFLLSSKFLEHLVLDELSLQERLKQLSAKQITEEICPLIACSEWCRQEFLECLRQLDIRDDREMQDIKSIVQEIENWQKNAIQYRQGLRLDKVHDWVERSLKELNNLISQGNLRVQVEFEPKKDMEKDTGLEMQICLLSMNLWIDSKDLPLGRFTENEEMKLQDCSLQSCLERDDLLVNLIRKVRWSLPDSLPNQIKFEIEFFLSSDFLKEPLEEICFPYGNKKRKPLGQEYPIFINSFNRYFDNDYLEIQAEIAEKKKALWDNKSLDSEHYYLGLPPSRDVLEEIEESLAIAVWSRDESSPLVEGVDLEVFQWQKWPQQIYELRRGSRRVALFWDDLYPKPSRRKRPLKSKWLEE